MNAALIFTLVGEFAKPGAPEHIMPCPGTEPNVIHKLTIHYDGTDPIYDVVSTLTFPECDVLSGDARLVSIKEVQAAIPTLFAFEVFRRQLNRLH